jgi:hypothetical protein
MYPEFTLGNVYRVLEKDNDYYRILDDAGAPALWPTMAFDVTDARRSPDWVDTRDEEGGIALHAPALADPPHLFEKWFDYDKRARQTLASYVTLRCQREAEALPDPPNTYLRVERHHDRADEPVVLYSELDEARYEVRKIEEYRDGRMTWASLRAGSSGTTRLGEQPTPSLRALNEVGELVATEIDRAVFESVFDQAFDDFDR